MTVPGEIEAFYARGEERGRLDRGLGRLEALRTWELLQRWLPAPPSAVLDVGGGAGSYALPLSAAGYHVHLLDPVPLHLEQADAASRESEHPLASVTSGHALDLPFPGDSADAVLLLGPLYHLPDRADRLLALGEVRRVLRPGGVVVAAAISRWASAVDALRTGNVRDAQLASVVGDDVRTGTHINPTADPRWFTTAYFHRPDDLRGELVEAGFDADGPVAVEGLAGVSRDLDQLLDDEETRDRVLDLVRSTEREAALLGASSHLIIAGHTPR